MTDSVFKSRNPVISNVVLGIVIFLSIVGYSLILVYEPELYWIIILVIIDIPLIGYLVLSINSIRYVFSHNKFECFWFGGSYEIGSDQIVGYYWYKLPLFEIHWSETNFIGTTITRRNIGKFLLLSPSLRTGLIIEIDKSFNNIEKIFITPRNQKKFIIELETIVFESFGKKFEEYKGKYYLKKN
ncbi:MAG: hypothetical protein ACXACX_21645 [Candidatus Hodarchaeales archaeon]|jgi:hypothetical protein